MKEQQQVLADKCCIAVYGFPEEGSDETQLEDMLYYLGCSGMMFHYSRIGKNTDNKTRPIKLELCSLNDKNIVLSRSSRLRDDNYYWGVRLSKWLSDAEVKSLNQQRRRCNELNMQHPSNKSDRRQFVVIDGVIKRRGPDGQLRVYLDKPMEGTSAAHLSASTQLSKNDH
jgi:hypothetical protein